MRAELFMTQRLEVDRGPVNWRSSSASTSVRGSADPTGDLERPGGRGPGALGAPPASRHHGEKAATLRGVVMRSSTFPLLSLLGFALALVGCSATSDPPGSHGFPSNTGGDGVGATGTGATAASGAGGGAASGATAGTGSAGAGNTGNVGTGNAGSGNTGNVVVGPGDYALPPPSQCHNADWQDGCIQGDASSRCGGVCNTINACAESQETKPGADVTFICPRFMLGSPEMAQAAIDDGNSAFNYAIVGHDADRGGIDGQDESTCCQCYQMVYAHPSPNNDRQVLADPDNPNPPVSAVPLPKPLIVQSFNTAATPQTFDVYMAAGGLGAHNACAPVLGSTSTSGQYLYTAYPPDGQTSQGGVKAASLYQECKTSINWVTTESLSSAACRSTIEAACSQIQSSIPGLTEQARASCLSTNDPNSLYHLNWSVYVMKVECPEHLTEVTGCKLAPQGLPAVDRNVTTAEQAAANASFWDHTGSTTNMYETTTMEDCCRPSCASKNWVEGRGLPADAQYNAFYSCDVNGVPITE